MNAEACCIDRVLQDQLNDEQRRAAVDPSRTILCLACAGSGKSRTLAYRIARLVSHGADPAGIVAITFTEKASESIKRRVAQALVQAGIDPRVLTAMYIGTIHAFCFEILKQMDARYNQFDVLDPNRLRILLMSRYRELELGRLMRRMNTPYFATIDRVSSALAVVNGELIGLDCITREQPALGRAMDVLRETMNREQFIDFSSMPRLVVEALRTQDPAALAAIDHVEHVMIDEYQDVEPALEALIQTLGGKAETLFCVGDDDQAIYAWKGADVNNILEFHQRHPGAARHTLSVNYRSTNAIVDCADDFVRQELGPQRVSKTPRAYRNFRPRDVGVLWFPDRNTEAEWVVGRIESLIGMGIPEGGETMRGLTAGDFAILMRSTEQSEQDGEPRHAAFTRRLGDRGIPFEVQSAGNVFARPHAQAVKDTFELLRDGVPDRETVRIHLETVVRPAFPVASFRQLAAVLASWGRSMHTPSGGSRVRVYPQQFLHEILGAFRIASTDLDPQALRDLGVVSQMVQDVESVYLSIDSAKRYKEMLNFINNPAGSGYDSSIREAVSRPDAVTVSTVHKMKGLEFPVVFVVDVEQGRFPVNRSQYRGWVPTSCIQTALDRGAFQGTRDGEIRLFYTAITRAERFLYISGSASLPGGRKTWRQSDFARRIRHPEVSADPRQLPDGLVPACGGCRLEAPIVPTSFSEVRQYLACPYQYKLGCVYGFSPPIREMFGFGRTVHTAVSALHHRFPSQAPSPEEAERLTEGIFHLKHVARSSDPVGRPGPYEAAKERAGEILAEYVASFEGDFGQRRQVEMGFEVPMANAVITGSIDLLLHEDSEGEVLEARVIDFKTINGGADPTRDPGLQWTELALQVQLYAHAASEVANEQARTGHVHLLKDNSRFDVPVGSEAVAAALGNVAWVIARVLDRDFPMRPHPDKCGPCDFRLLCPKVRQSFNAQELPPEIHVLNGETQLARAFSQCTDR